MQRSYRHGRPTIGVLCGVEIRGGIVQPYSDSILRGIHAAARDRACNLLVAGGVTHPYGTPNVPIAWPVPSPSTCFLPVGPWNTDGLIAPMPMEPQLIHYVLQIREAGHPVIFLGGGQAGLTVEVDNAGGINQALNHLLQHGHRSIAFIAGVADHPGDGMLRLTAYESFVREHDLTADPRLIAYGSHDHELSRQAMQRILASSVEFSAVLGSNDEAALGAIQALCEAGYRVPQDVAVVGFDNMARAALHSPPLASIHFSVFDTGYQALTLLLDQIEGEARKSGQFLVPTRLVARESCGCTTDYLRQQHSLLSPIATQEHTLLQCMQEQVLLRTQQMHERDIQDACACLSAAFLTSLQRNEPEPFQTTLITILHRTEDTNGSEHAWQGAISVLHDNLAQFLGQPDIITERQKAEELLRDARITISDHIQLHFQKAVIYQHTTLTLLGEITTRLHTTLDKNSILETLAHGLPSLGIRHLHAAFYEADNNDPVAWSRLHATHDEHALRFPSRSFPPRNLYPPEEPFHLALLPLLLQDGPIGYIAVDVHDLALCVIIAAQLASALQSAQLYHMKNNFLSIVSHELHTPLNLIVGLSEMLLHEPAQLAPSIIDDVRQIHASARHLNGLIRDVLDLTRSEAGQLRIDKVELDLTEVLLEAAEIGQRLALQNGLIWHCELPPVLPLVSGDRTRILQIVLNLISNAVKFTSEGSITMTATITAKKVLTSISDTGPGIPQEEHTAIFDEFRQSARTASQNYRGMGLGLAICKQLVRLHGGEIWVHSPREDGPGSTFSFTLPFIPHPAHPSHHEPLPLLPKNISTPFSHKTYLSSPLFVKQRSDEKTILIVDDDPGILDMHARMVQTLSPHYCILKALGGKEALTRLQQMLPDLVLLDLMMSDVSGFAVLDALRERESTLNVPVIVLTAQILTEADMMRLHQGMTTVLDKGIFSMEETLRHVETALSHERRLGHETQRLVHKALAYLHTHYAEPASLESAARYVGVSKIYLSNCFQREIGISFVTYLNRYRIHQAKYLLSRSGKSIAQVAAAVGFSNPRYFHRVFQREVGLSPSEYQKQ